MKMSDTLKLHFPYYNNLSLGTVKYMTLSYIKKVGTISII